jgi:Leu/Phe-tRNA-protein transferase
MSNYEATGIAEGWIEANSEDQVIEAWQHLHNTGLAYSLQGWFGRTARDLIEQGIINE